MQKRRQDHRTAFGYVKRNNDRKDPEFLHDDDWALSCKIGRVYGYEGTYFK